MMYYANGFYPSHMFGLSPIFMIGFWIVVGYVVFKILKKGHLLSGGNTKAVDILKERYAKSEITKEQFESMKKDLQ